MVSRTYTLLLSQDCIYKAVSVVTKAYAESCGCWIITKSIIMLLGLYTSNYLLKGIDKRINSACQEQPENVLETNTVRCSVTKINDQNCIYYFLPACLLSSLPVYLLPFHFVLFNSLLQRII